MTEKTKSNLDTIKNTVFAGILLFIAVGIWGMRDKLTVLAPAVANNTTINQQQQCMIDDNKIKLKELETTVKIKLE